MTADRNLTFRIIFDPGKSIIPAWIMIAVTSDEQANEIILGRLNQHSQRPTAQIIHFWTMQLGIMTVPLSAENYTHINAIRLNEVAGIASKYL
jgi:hypothetical protein